MIYNIIKEKPARTSLFHDIISIEDKRKSGKVQ